MHWSFITFLSKKLHGQWKARGRALIWLRGCGIDENFMCICQCMSSGYLFVRDVKRFAVVIYSDCKLCYMQRLTVHQQN